MSSNLACVGLGIEDEEDLGQLLAGLTPEPVSLGRRGNLQVVRWEDGGWSWNSIPAWKAITRRTASSRPDLLRAASIAVRCCALGAFQALADPLCSQEWRSAQSRRRGLDRCTRSPFLDPPRVRPLG